MASGWFRLINGVQKLDVFPSSLRVRLLRIAGVDAARSARVMSGVHFTHPGVRLGEGAFVNIGCLFEGDGAIVLEDGVYLAPRVSILTSGHAIDEGAWRAGRLMIAPVTIGGGSWIGAAAILLPGSIVGRGCVVGAGALVRAGRLDPDGLYVGVPARRKSDLPVVVSPGGAGQSSRRVLVEAPGADAA